MGWEFRGRGFGVALEPVFIRSMRLKARLRSVVTVPVLAAAEAYPVKMTEAAIRRPPSSSNKRSTLERTAGQPQISTVSKCRSRSKPAHVRRMTRLYRERRDCLIRALKAEVGERFSVDAPAGGMQLLARCTGPDDDRDLSRRLLELGVVARPLSDITGTMR